MWSFGFEKKENFQLTSLSWRVGSSKFAPKRPGHTATVSECLAREIAGATYRSRL